MVKHLKENEFDSEVIKADGVSIVDFWAFINIYFCKFSIC